jgi:hypothetical protein
MRTTLGRWLLASVLCALAIATVLMAGAGGTGTDDASAQQYGTPTQGPTGPTGTASPTPTPTATPNAKVSVKFKRTRRAKRIRWVKVRRFRMTNLPPGTTATVRCKKPRGTSRAKRRSCAFKRRVKVNQTNPGFKKAFKKRRIRRGTRITLTLTQPTYGRSVIYRYRVGKRKVRRTVS